MSMYKHETIEKVISQLNAEINYYRYQNDIKICISSGNKKIGKVLNVSLPPIFTCHNCSECKFYCYDIKACMQYKNVRSARARNLVLLRANRASYFAQIRHKIARTRECRAFRWHVSGDIPDMSYLEEMIMIAEENPSWTFWTYTKHYSLINAYCDAHGGSKDCIPSNLSIMFSKWEGLPMDNRYNFAEFACEMYSGEYKDSHKWLCPGNCEVCLEHRTGCPYNVSSRVGVH
jgi:hypothetical protein